MLVDAGRAEGAGADADGQPAAFEVAQEGVPLRAGGSVVLLGGTLVAAAGEEGAVRLELSFRMPVRREAAPTDVRGSSLSGPAHHTTRVIRTKATTLSTPIDAAPTHAPLLPDPESNAVLSSKGRWLTLSRLNEGRRPGGAVQPGRD